MISLRPLYPENRYEPVGSKTIHNKIFRSDLNSGHTGIECPYHRGIELTFEEEISDFRRPTAKTRCKVCAQSENLQKVSIHLVEIW